MVAGAGSAGLRDVVSWRNPPPRRPRCRRHRPRHRLRGRPHRRRRLRHRRPCRPRRRHNLAVPVSGDAGLDAVADATHGIAFPSPAPSPAFRTLRCEAAAALGDLDGDVAGHIGDPMGDRLCRARPPWRRRRRPWPRPREPRACLLGRGADGRTGLVGDVMGDAGYGAAERVDDRADIAAGVSLPPVAAPPSAWDRPEWTMRRSWGSPRWLGLGRSLSRPFSTGWPDGPSRRVWSGSGGGAKSADTFLRYLLFARATSRRRQSSLSVSPAPGGARSVQPDARRGSDGCGDSSSPSPSSACYSVSPRSSGRARRSWLSRSCSLSSCSSPGSSRSCVRPPRHTAGARILSLIIGILGFSLGSPCSASSFSAFVIGDLLGGPRDHSFLSRLLRKARGMAIVFGVISIRRPGHLHRPPILSLATLTWVIGIWLVILGVLRSSRRSACGDPAAHAGAA